MKKVYLIIALILLLSTVATLVILNGKKKTDDFDGNVTSVIKSGKDAVWYKIKVGN